MEFFLLFIKLIIAFGIVLALMYLLYKLSDTKMKQLNNTKYIKVLERTQISKDGSLILVKLGDKGYIMSSSTGKNEIIKELNDDELEKYESSKIQSNYDNIVTNYFTKIKKNDSKVTNYFKKMQKDENNE
ncbi:MAG: flagellar biosynthetic protein FliO [Clostridium sp.]